LRGWSYDKENISKMFTWSARARRAGARQLRWDRCARGFSRRFHGAPRCVGGIKFRRLSPNSESVIHAGILPQFNRRLRYA